MRALASILGRLRPRLLRGLLAAWLLATLAVTLAPFWPLRASPRAFATESRLGPPWDFALNVVLFLPCGGLLSLLGVRPSLAAAAGALLSFGIEAAQMHLPYRHPSQLDILANMLGAALGALAAARLRPAAP